MFKNLAVQNNLLLEGLVTPHILDIKYDYLNYVFENSNLVKE